MPTLSDPRESEDRLVNAIVAKAADFIMKLVEEVSLGSMTAKTLENARVLVALDRIRSKASPTARRSRESRQRRRRTRSAARPSLHCNGRQRVLNDLRADVPAAKMQ